MMIMRQAMEDPSLSGGCFLLAELFAALAEAEDAQSLLEATPAWKIPPLLLSAALLFRASGRADHPLAKYLAPASAKFGAGFREDVRRSLREDRAALSALLAAHTYQCNPPRRMAVSLVALGAFATDWPAAWHIDVGTASGIGLLLGDVAVLAGERMLGLPDAPLRYPLDLRGSPPDPAALCCPKIERSIGIDLDPPNLRDPACLAWMRACQYPVPAELAYFDRAVERLLARDFRIERGPATDLLPALAAEMPPDLPLVVTDTYVAVFMSEDDREKLRCELDRIAQARPVIWISNNPLVPAGPAPTATTAGTPIPPELLERNQCEMFGAVCVTTWPGGRRTPQLVGLTHPGGCWLDWRAE